MAQKTLGKRLKQRRLALGLTQKQLAAMAQVSCRSIQALEQGVTQGITMAHAIMLARALDWSTDEMYGMTRQGRRKTL